MEFNPQHLGNIKCLKIKNVLNLQDFWYVTPKRLVKFLIKWSLPLKHTFLFLNLMYYSGNMFRLAIESSSGPYIKIEIYLL